MTEAETILRMIETVSPDDTAKLDEIDARVYVYVWNRTTPPYFSKDHGFWQIIDTSTGKLFFAEEFTRSRDALKTIRPDGWWVQIFLWSKSGNPKKHYDHKYWCSLTMDDHLKGYTNSPFLPTEELAELHAIIQAIQYERSRADME